ncbi:MAG TPA: EamA family transporter [Candidatus Krumholzibacteria bacterium]|nr:EamA family transporter [Candidatus Krumholzibacteria bacterium]
MNVRGLAHLLIVYVVWGSTYLAIRIAVREGSGFPPFYMAGTRIIIASCILFLLCMVRGKSLKPTKRDWYVFAASGVLLWFGGNGLVSWAEMRAASGYAAILVGSQPLWTMFLESVIDRRRPTWRMIMALVVGLAGIVVLNYHVLQNPTRDQVAPAIALCVAVMLWGTGMIIQKRKPVSLSGEANSAYQLLFGSCALLLAAVITREPRPTPTHEAWLAWGYLIVFGSVIAFTSFVKALQMLPMSIVTTYGYVNPVIAVLLGAIFISEPITRYTIAGSALTLLGVAGVFHEQQHRKREQKLATAKAAAH